MTIDRINTKHAALVAQRGQLEQAIAQANANLNATIGAIAACEELRAEMLEDQSKAAAVAVVEAANIPEAVVTVEESAPEMLPVVSEFVPCSECPNTLDCDVYGRCCCD